MRVSGSCHCGLIAFEAEVDSRRVVICHCADCQKLTGTVYRASVGTTRDKLLMLRGNPAVYIKTADSGARRAQAFCPTCGSPLLTYDIEDPERVGLRVGCIDQRDGLRPSRQIWCRSALPWSANIESVRKRDGE